MSFLEVRDLKKKYPDFTLDLSFSIEEGEFLCLIGPSGSGKSTVLNILTGIESADEGKIILDGVDITDKPIQARDIGLVFQDYALFSNMNVEKNIQYGMNKKKKSGKEIKEMTALLLSYVGLEGYEKRRVSSLSGGEAQRVALARSLASEPKVLLLDEPLSALDGPLRKRLRSVIRNIHDKTGITIIYVTHDREEAFAISDRIIVMKDGSVIACSDAETLYTHPQSEFVASFTGDGTLLPSSLFFEGDERSIFFRPESVLISEESIKSELKPSYLVINNTEIVSIEYTGSHYLICTSFKGHLILASTLVRPRKKIISLMINKESVTRL